MEKLKKNAAALVEESRSKIEEIDAHSAIALILEDDVHIVDLRDIREREREGYIPGSFHCPRGMTEFWVDPDSPYYKPFFGQGGKYIFHCASGWRSAITVSVLQEMGFKHSAHIKDGFTSWKAAGGPVEGKN